MQPDDPLPALQAELYLTACQLHQTPGQPS